MLQEAYNKVQGQVLGEHLTDLFLFKAKKLKHWQLALL